MIREAETVVLNRVWNGKNARFPLKSHIGKHREAHNDMVRASQNMQYEVPNDSTRVSRLLASLTTSDGRVVAAKTTIMADDAKKSNFELAADFLLTAAPHHTSDFGNNHRISQVQTEGGGRKRKGKVQVGKTGVEFRYYKRNEFKRLSDDQIEELVAWREKNDNGGKKAKGNANKHSISAIMTRLEQLSHTVAAINQQPAAALPPAPAAAPPAAPANPLQPPTGFAQRGARQN